MFLVLVFSSLEFFWCRRLTVEHKVYDKETSQKQKKGVHSVLFLSLPKFNFIKTSRLSNLIVFIRFTHIIMISEWAQVQFPNCNNNIIFFQFYNGRRAKFLTIVISQWLLCNLARRHFFSSAAHIIVLMAYTPEHGLPKN